MVSMKIEIIAKNLEQTELFAGALARRLKGGEIIELVGDVGAGKTSFTKAIVAGLESDEDVTSPTFAISNVYEAGRLPVYHFDFYRLEDNDQMIRHELSEVAEDSSGIVIMEWAESVRDVLDKPSLTVKIETLDDDTRKFELSIPKEYRYLSED